MVWFTGVSRWFENWTSSLPGDEAAQGRDHQGRCSDGAGGQFALTVWTVVRRCAGEPGKRPRDHQDVVQHAGNQLQEIKKERIKESGDELVSVEAFFTQLDQKNCVGRISHGAFLHGDGGVFCVRSLHFSQ